MNAETRLADIVTTLRAGGTICLVMGGHAVRYYGVGRNTIDYGLHLAPEAWEQLPSKLAQLPFLAGQPLVEGPSWRPNDFRRFQIGRLPDGRKEWLEFWRSNHLLPPFADLFQRREEGLYGGRTLPFLSLPDLIHSKETERESDWQDIALLEECLDARQLAQAASGRLALATALAQLRSRQGFEQYLQRGQLAESTVVMHALGEAHHPVTQALLLPFASAWPSLPSPLVPIEPVVFDRLRAVQPCSPLHLALVEVVRRQYKTARQAADRANKDAIRAAQGSPPWPSP